ncbi:MAG: efflux RND transporter periplasmic adaptor subunit [Thermodesulfovibrionia bacterium]|nr:efflux RND transporter periplasmic adaptor subunit [Thermodesulfovibrionia bacterium]
MKTDTESDIIKTLGVEHASGSGKRLKRWLVIVLLLLILGAVLLIWWRRSENANAPQYKTKEAARGNIIVTVTATGTLKPVNQVDVSSELSGIIKTVEADYNDQVKAGQILAKLDTEILEAKVVQSKAALDAAEAKLLETKATVEESHNQLARLKKVWEISNKKVPSQHEMDTAEAALKRAEAMETSAKAQVSEAKAALNTNKTNLTKAIIRSPINGIVISRSVEPGQTVAASFQAPVLFTMAENLTQMELYVDVDEADVGQVKEGQAATFTVDAYPDRTFEALITQVRYGSKTVGGVVTYETVLSMDNSDLSLRPGMTASADIIVKKIEDVILVPNTALRFLPVIQEEEAPSSSGGSLIGKLIRPPRHASRANGDKSSDKKEQRVWILKEGKPFAIQIVVGSSDGIMTEVVSGDVEPGMELLVDMNNTKK